MQIRDAVFVKSSTEVSKCPPPTVPEFAFIGRSNVGKSSLINMLVQKKGLAKTSGRPGKTQTINHFLVTTSGPQWMLVDLPGYGYAKTAKSNRTTWAAFIRNYLLKRENLHCVFALIDARLEPQTLDIEFIVQLGEWQVPFAIAFTKADKLKPQALQRNVEVFCEKVLEHFTELPHVFVTSATDRTGRDNLLQFVNTTLTADRSDESE
jgi:GTP-binding protein